MHVCALAPGRRALPLALALGLAGFTATGFAQQLQERLGPQGAGGLITIVNFANTNLGVQAGSTVALGLRRVGILDGSRQARLAVADPDRPLFTPQSFTNPVFLAVDSSSPVAVTLGVSSNAWLPQAPHGGRQPPAWHGLQRRREQHRSVCAARPPGALCPVAGASL